MPSLYDELRRLARVFMAREDPGHTLQATAIANEAYLRLRGVSELPVGDRTHFLAIAANMIRRILVDHARAAKADKRGGNAERVTLSVVDFASDQSPLDVLALEQALESLAQARPRAARVVEMRFFGGLGMSGIAKELEVSERTVASDWSFAQAWLRRALAETDART